MISKSLSTSRKFAELQQAEPELGEFSQVLFCLLVTHADDFGRLAGDTFTVKHLVIPTSPRSLAELDKALTALVKVGLIARASVSGSQVIQVLNFDNHQVGLHKRTHSSFPELPGMSEKVQEVPGNSGSRARAELNLTEQNLTELKKTGSNGNGNHVAVPTKALMTLFDQLHRKKLNTKYPFTNAKKDAALIAKLYRDRHDEEPNAEDLIRSFFASNDPFIVNAGYSVGVLMSQVSKLISQGRAPVRGQNLRSVDWQAECKRLHNSRCTNVNFHAAKMAEQAEA